MFLDGPDRCSVTAYPLRLGDADCQSDSSRFTRGSQYPRAETVRVTAAGMAGAQGPESFRQVNGMGTGVVIDLAVM